MSTETPQEAAPFDEWAIVELMGRIRTAGRLREQEIAGGHFLRLDIHEEEGPAVMTQLIPPPPGGPVYRITITTEAMARKIGAHSLPEPVARWELGPAKPSDSGSRSGWQPVNEDEDTWGDEGDDDD